MLPTIMQPLRRHVSSRIASRVGFATTYRYSWLNRMPALRYHSSSTGTLSEQIPQNEGPAITETNRAEATMKRFWKTVGIKKRGDSLAITLDKRTLKTPDGNPLLIPVYKPLLATLIAAEWDHQKSLIKPHALPMTSLASRAIDTLSKEPTRAQVREALLNYIDTDTICFYENTTPQIERLQAEHWDPLFEWLRETFGVVLIKHESILFNIQLQETREKLGKIIGGFDQWQMAAMERATYTTKSFVIAMALVLRHLTPEQAALAASVEVNSQIERWGEVEDTHDVDFHDIRRQLSSAASLLSASSQKH